MNFRSGIVALDRALGDGIPGGNILEISGHSDSSKTALALWFLRTLQAADNPDTIAAWVSTEVPLTAANLRWAGINTDRLIVARQCPSLPGLDIACGMVEGGCSLVVVDSVAALTGQPEDTLREVLGRSLGPLKESVEEHRALVILVNQERHCGRSHRLSSSGASIALLRACNYRLRLRTGEGIYRGGIWQGSRIHFQIASNGYNLDSGGSGVFNCSWSSGLYDLRGQHNNL